MPRYFFAVHDGTSIEDDEGTELPDLQAAKREAIRYAAALLSENKASLWGGEHWHMEVTDEAGMLLLRLDFIANVGPDVA